MSQRKSLGSAIRRIRFERDWTLAQMSAATGIPLSTLARIERDQGSLTYDKLLELSERLEISLLELFSMPEVPRAPGATGRRSGPHTKMPTERISRNGMSVRNLLQ